MLLKTMHKRLIFSFVTDLQARTQGGCNARENGAGGVKSANEDGTERKKVESTRGE
jgi:hypothetical protein